MAKLLLSGAGGQALELPLKSGVNRVGCVADNDIQIEDPSVSSHHCELTCVGDAVIVKDLGSTNGTFIDGSPVREATLQHGQRLQLGSVDMVLDRAVPSAGGTVHLHAASRPAATSSRRVPAKNPYQADRSQAEAQARSKMLWGDGPEEVTKFLMMQGLSADEASSLTAVLLKERVRMLRGMGIRKICVGLGLTCGGGVSLVMMVHNHVLFFKLPYVASFVVFWGAWLVLKGLFMTLAPKSEPGDVADK